MLVNQLLQQIKLLQQYQHRQSLLSSSGHLKNNPALVSQLTVQITKAKALIQNFQVRIK